MDSSYSRLVILSLFSVMVRTSFGLADRTLVIFSMNSFVVIDFVFHSGKKHSDKIDNLINYVSDCRLCLGLISNNAGHSFPGLSIDYCRILIFQNLPFLVVQFDAQYPQFFPCPPT